MTESTPFSQHLAAIQGSSTPKVATKRTVKTSSFVAPSGATKSAQSQGANDPISHIISALSSGLYAVSNIPNQILNESIKAQKANLDGTPYDVWGGIGNVLTSAPRGFYAGLSGTNPEDTASWAQIIEKGVDAANVNDPKYVDTANNVDPALAGTLGFVGDVGLDPLSYIPFLGWEAKGAQLLGKAGAGIKSLVKGEALGKEAQSIADAADLAKASETINPNLYNDTVSAADQVLQDTTVAPTHTATTPAKTGAPVVDNLAEVANGHAKASETIAKSNAKVAEEAAKIAGPVEALPTIDEKILKQPKVASSELGFSGTKTAPQELADNIARVGRGEAEAVPTQESWANSVRAKVQSSSQVTPEIKKLNEVVSNPESRDAVYARFADGVRKYGIDSVNYFGMPKGHESVQSWLATLVKQGDKRNVAEVAGKKFSAQDVMRMATSGEKMPEADLNLLKQQLDSKFSETLKGMEKPAKVSGDNFSAALREEMQANPDKWKALLPKSTYDRWNNPKFRADRLEKEAGVLKDIGTGKKTLADIWNVAEDPNKTVISQYTDFLFGNEADWNGIDAYNLAQRSSVSNVNNPEVQAAIKQMMASGDVEGLLTMSGVPSSEAKIVSRIAGSWIKKITGEYHSFEFVSKSGALQETEKLGVGRAYKANEVNSFDMMELTQRLWKETRKEVNLFKSDFSMEEQANAVFSAVMRRMTYIEHVLDMGGVPLWTNVPRGQRFLLSPTQVLFSLHEVDPDLVKMLVANPDTRAPFTYIMEAVSRTLENGGPLDRAYLDKILTGKVDAEYAKSIGRAKSVAKNADHNSFVDNADGYAFGRKGKVTTRYQASELRDRMAAALDGSIDNLASLVKSNSEAYAARWGAEAADLTVEQIDYLKTLAADEKFIGRQMQASTNLVRAVHADATSSGALSISEIRAVENLKSVVPQPAVDIADGAVKATNAAKKAAKEGKTARQVADAGIKGQKESLNAAFVSSDELTKLAETLPDLADASDLTIASTKAASQVEAGRTAILAPLSPVWDWFAHRFSRFHEMPQVANVWHAVGQTMAHLRLPYLDALKQMVKDAGKLEENGKPLLNRIYADVQAGTPTKGYEELYQRMASLVSRTHAVDSETGAFADAYLRTVQDIEQLNEALRMAKLPDDYLYDINAAKTAVKNGEYNDVLDALSQQWRKLKIDDPMDYLAKRDFALMNLATDQAVGASLDKLAREIGAMSTTAKPGFIKATNLEGKYFKFLDKDAYYDATLLKELKPLEKFAAESRANQIKFIQDYYMPVQNLWKLTVTVFRPGHHIRNFIGGQSLVYVAEGTNGYVRNYKAGQRILAYKNNYEDADIVRALQQQGFKEAGNARDVLFKMGKEDFTSGEGYDAMVRYGLMPNYIDAEDLAALTGKGKFQKVTDTLGLKDTKARHIAGKASEYVDHSNRAHHFSMILWKNRNAVGAGKRFATKDELFRYAANRVKKFHPDGSMLTPWEARNMRTVIPFYGWFRGVLPGIFESLLLNPGRVMTFPKASFNLAYGMGVNPDSLYDPFPTNEMFPSFLTNQVTGPVFKLAGNYIGLNPGIAHLDVANQLAQGMGGVIGMTSPLLRMPIEMATGTQLATGSKIKDPSDYLDSNIPGLNYLSNISGQSATGSIVSMLQGKGLDPQLAQAKGNKTGLDQALSASNWVTGLGAANFSKPNYKNYAEIQKRNQAAQDQNARSGF